MDLESDGEVPLKWDILTNIDMYVPPICCVVNLWGSICGVVSGGLCYLSWSDGVFCNTWS